MAVDSRVIALHRHDSFAALLNATLWNADVHTGRRIDGDAGRTAAPGPQVRVASMSFASARSPNVFCSQPLDEAAGCGAYDMLLLFRASEELARKAGSITLHDACGLFQPRHFPRCPQSVTAWRPAHGTLASDRICTFGCRKSKDAGCTRSTQGNCRVPADRTPTPLAWLDSSMNAFQQACHPSVSNTSSYAYSWTCGNRHVSAGRLNNELQFTNHDILEELMGSLLAVGIIDDEAAQSAQRLCRARHVASVIGHRFLADRPPLEVWRFGIDSSAVASPKHKTPNRFKSLLHSRDGGGSGQVSDFAGRSLPLASYYGYYDVPSRSFERWHRVI